MKPNSKADNNINIKPLIKVMPDSSQTTTLAFFILHGFKIKLQTEIL